MIIPANPGFSVIFADLNKIRQTLSENPDASIGEYVGCQSVIAWHIDAPLILPVTYTHIEYSQMRFRVLEETDRQALEAQRRNWAKEVYTEVLNEKGQAR